MHTFAFAELSPFAIFAVVVMAAVIAAASPISPLEPVMIGVAMLGRPALILPVVAIATISQMAAKTGLFLGSRKATGVLSPRKRAFLDRVGARLAGRRWLQILLVLVSAIFSLPPFYLVTITCGALRLPLRDYVVVATVGRVIRFTTLMMLPRLFTAGHH
jgi:membrane protein YqaA with SNARE-associated domain